MALGQLSLGVQVAPRQVEEDGPLLAICLHDLAGLPIVLVVAQERLAKAKHLPHDMAVLVAKRLVGDLQAALVAITSQCELEWHPMARNHSQGAPTCGARRERPDRDEVRAPLAPMTWPATWQRVRWAQRRRHQAIGGWREARPPPPPPREQLLMPRPPKKAPDKRKRLTTSPSGQSLKRQSSGTTSALIPRIGERAPTRSNAPHDRIARERTYIAMTPPMSGGCGHHFFGKSATTT